MPDVALIVFDGKTEEKSRGWFSRVGLMKLRTFTALYYLFKRNQFKSGIRTFETEEGTTLLQIKLPFPLSSLSAYNISFIRDYIAGVLKSWKCGYCFAPGEAIIHGWFTGYSINENVRPTIFKSLLIPIVENIYMNNRIRMDNLDIVFAGGDDAAELAIMIRQLEPFARYISVAAYNKEEIESQLSALCIDSGISIFVGRDYKSIFRNADLIINLADPVLLSKYRLKPGCLVLDYSNGLKSAIQCECAVLTGVTYLFPSHFYQSLGEDIPLLFSSQEVAEIILAFRSGILNDSRYNEGTSLSVLNNYNKCRGQIIHYTGRRDHNIKAFVDNKRVVFYNN